MLDTTISSTGAPHLTVDTFDQALVDAGELPVFIDFYAEWCGPCKLAAPVVDKMVGEYAGKAIVVKVDVDENRELAEKFGVMSIPTTIIMKKDGEEMKEVDRKVGYPGEAGFKAMLDKQVA